MSQNIDAFLEHWTQDKNAVKPLFLALYDCLKKLGAELDYKERPGVSISLRAKNPRQKFRDFFVLLDIIDDEPEARWLSICFYSALVSDAEERGDVVPSGLGNEDARCFDVDIENNDIRAYLIACLKEAFARAAE